MGVYVFVFGRGEHVERAVSALGVVQELDVVVDGGGELDPGLPGLLVERFDLQLAQKGSTMALS